jgi:NAD(P)-dependent dehydrogenase (short-subunit alcohol dehydrogenase family)
MFGTAKVAVVSGVGPGMGRSIALGLARGGVDVVLAARRAERLEAVAAEVRALGREPLVVPTDITDRDACQRLVAAAEERFGGIDVLVQNGHHEGDWQRVVDADPDVWRGIFDVNLFGALHLVQAVVPVMGERGGGSIILVNSGAAVRTPATMGAYSTSKAALAAERRATTAWSGRRSGDGSATTSAIRCPGSGPRTWPRPSSRPWTGGRPGTPTWRSVVRTR